MLKLQTLTATNFRSWKSLSFTFQPGLTVLLGANGAGKTSIRYATQYALTGNVPGLRKADLLRLGCTASHAFDATVTCTVDGKPTTIKRGKNGTSVQQDGDEYSVRDASFMDRIKLSVGFAFLSAEQAHFVDVQEFKRKEMLTSLIAEVNFLRNKCVPYGKDLLEKLNSKKIKISHDVDSLYILRDEIEMALAEARNTAATEKARIDGLLTQAEVGLPMTREQYEAGRNELIVLADAIQEARRKITEGTNWTTRAYKHNERCAEAVAGVVRAQNAVTVQETELAGVLATLEYAKEALTCPHCQGVMVCSSCGKRIVSGEDKEQRLLARHVELEASIASGREIVRGLEASLAEKFAPIAPEDIARISATVRELGMSVQVNEARTRTLEDAVHEYDVANARSEELYKVAEHKEHLKSLVRNIQTIQFRLGDVDATITRKSKSLDAIDKLMGEVRIANTVMNEIMPSMYFNMFLSRLNDFCNFLLSQISDMHLELSANEDGISIKIDDKEVKQLSSGERQRVRIATTLAFSLMAPGTDTLFIDEVFDAGLDAEGVQALALLLSTHMKGFFRNIIMISHQPALSSAIGADRVINILEVDGLSEHHTAFSREVA